MDVLKIQYEAMKNANKIKNVKIYRENSFVYLAPDTIAIYAIPKDEFYLDEKSVYHNNTDEEVLHRGSAIKNILKLNTENEVGVISESSFKYQPKKGKEVFLKKIHFEEGHLYIEESLLKTFGKIEELQIKSTMRKAIVSVQISLTSNVLQQFGRQIEAVIRDTLTHYGIENAEVTAVDKGALDCTVRARVTAAIFRSAQSDAYEWEVK